MVLTGPFFFCCIIPLKILANDQFCGKIDHLLESSRLKLNSFISLPVYDGTQSFFFPPPPPLPPFLAYNHPQCARCKPRKFRSFQSNDLAVMHKHTNMHASIHPYEPKYVTDNPIGCTCACPHVTTAGDADALHWMKYTISCTSGHLLNSL